MPAFKFSGTLYLLHVVVLPTTSHVPSSYPHHTFAFYTAQYQSFFLTPRATRKSIKQMHKQILDYLTFVLVVLPAIVVFLDNCFKDLFLHRNIYDIDGLTLPTRLLSCPVEVTHDVGE